MSQNHYNGDIGVKINSHSFTKTHKSLHSTLSNTCLKPWPAYFPLLPGGLRVDILHTQIFWVCQVPISLETGIITSKTI